MTPRYNRLSEAIVAAVRKGSEGKDVGVAFSGGLDSGLVAAIAKDYARSVTLYTCSSPGSYDVVMAHDMSSKLGLPWVHVPLSKENVEPLIKEMIAATGTSDPFTLSYELPLFCVCRASEEATMLTGQGADEYFMGCAKYVGASDADYETLKGAGVERLMYISVPCEKRIAAHFGKDLFYPYLETAVVSEIEKIDPAELRPADMDSRKSVLKAIAVDMGYPSIADRKKKSSQYGSGTTDLVRALAKGNGKMYNEYIASLYSGVVCGGSSNKRGSAIDARIDTMVKVRAEGILREQGITPSEAIEMFYMAIIEGKGLTYPENEIIFQSKFHLRSFY